MVFSSAQAHYVETRFTAQVGTSSCLLLMVTHAVSWASGLVTLGDILEILPFEDPIVVLELDGETLWAALEASLETWPAQEGSVTTPHIRA